MLDQALSLSSLEALLDEPGVVAVGECGLDFFYDHSPAREEERAMREQWELALDKGLPVVVHNRDNNELMMKIFSDPAYKELRADFDSFAGGLELGRNYLNEAAISASPAW